MYRLEPTLQNYAWGMSGVIETMLGRPVTDEPVAEAWWGAHPSAPALATAMHAVRADEVGLYPGDVVPLDRLIARDPAAMLGHDVVVRWERLPYLLKVLAIAKPLSLQVHPTLAQADEGFRREQAIGVPLDAAARTFKDRSHKPEMIVALTPMTLLAGFRKAPAVAADLMRLGLECTRAWAEELNNSTEPTVALREYVSTVLTHPDAGDAVARLAEVGTGADASEGLAVAAATLADFPGDVGALVALALNVVRLEPGEACFTEAGVVHSYQSGLGVEIMANSDNVVRAGLTPKQVDIPLLVALTDGTPGPPPRVAPQVDGPVTHYPAPVGEFALTVVRDGAARVAPGPRIVLAVDGTVDVRAGSGGLGLRRGQAAFVPYCDGELHVDAHGMAVVAEVP
ncbi:mannose-6-phosphate isomerase, class I [Demequina sp. SYSU T00039]|uniref:mannose-6-phosphate isomerase n=1 Tax=Demequina lignilytica TaxID=3051663 RepID=A0AAW7M5C9_9MICO|nr:MULTISPECIES: mannose-6-phosphate isomerase, class I [unclassified Demequina]MDN4477511.1 mannose-6-phosphate isomerase, class I [Demequina sp. SYSU T00039-1]MDN4488138.1 mannose-6-phosphate isomerase, class I [Demequina sp. SYSU T00039]MDN4490579.1 mannose-6-phosphate isomerase, class I [Demequina sp. SYSU T00068]